MIDYHSQMMNALGTIGLPLHYELVINSKTKTPCITYLELTNFVEEQSDITDITRIQYQIKIWDTSIKTIQHYAKEIDETLRTLGWRRTSSAELFDKNSTMIQKILTFEALATEEFE